jgi:hypothetical protein
MPRRTTWWPEAVNQDFGITLYVVTDDKVSALFNVESLHISSNSFY